MITENLFEEVLLRPSKSFDKLKIISGYASSAMAYEHLDKLSGRASIDLVVGMTSGDGLGIGAHKGFQELNTSTPNFNCNYVVSKPPVHVKSYIWLKDEKPLLAFTGSGNYSQNTFFHRTKESFAEDNPDDCNNLFDLIKKSSLNCLDRAVDAKIKFYHELYRRNYIEKAFEDAVVAEPTTGLEPHLKEDCHVVSWLVSSTGETHNAGAGINWGQPTLTRTRGSPDEAYLAVPVGLVRTGFFPPKARHFTMVTDDNLSFDMVLAQGDIGKALETPKDNSLLGKYIRRRMGVPLGVYVTRQHFEAYGRTDVEICKIDNETYFMDFSI